MYTVIAIIPRASMKVVYSPFTLKQNKHLLRNTRSKILKALQKTETKVQKDAEMAES